MKRNEAYFIVIATFIVIVVWIIFSILDSAVSSTISKGLNAQIAPISPTFNTKIIDGLKTRKEVLPENLEAVPAASSSASPVSFEIQGPRPTTQPATTSSVLQGVNL